MISWILSKLFSVKTLTLAIGKHPDVFSVEIVSGKEIEGMASEFMPRRGPREHHQIH